MRLITLLAVSSVAAGWISYQVPAALAPNAEALQKAQGLSMTISVQKIGGAVEEHKITLGKPGSFRWDSPTKLTVSDGKTTWILDKGTNTFSEEPFSAQDAAGLLKDERFWAWGSFFDAEWNKRVLNAKAGTSRTFKGIKVLEVSTALKPGPVKPLNLFLDEKTKVVRGGVITLEGGPNAGEYIVFTPVFEVLAAAPDAATFAFSAPNGAKKQEKAAAGAVPFEKVNAILMGNCVGCHGSRGAKAGLSVSSYASFMRGGRSGSPVVPGDPENSLIMQHITGNGRQIMPPVGKMPDAPIETIRAWIAAGAKNP